MIAFAANSVLTRLAISNNQLGPASFSFIRLISGSIVLIIIVIFRSGLPSIWKTKPNQISILGLSFYMVGFHFAYNSLDAGLGAIVLFGGVQLVMFTSTILSKEKTTAYNWVGMLLAMLKASSAILNEAFFVIFLNARPTPSTGLNSPLPSTIFLSA